MRAASGHAEPRRRGGAGRAVLAGVLAVAWFGGPTASIAADRLDLSGFRALPDATLDSLRGGFRLGGFDLALGITVSTAVDNAVVLRTSFNVVGRNRIDDIRREAIGATPAPPQPPGSGDDANPALDGSGVAVIPGGIQFTSPGTRIVQQLDSGLLTEITNSADGRTISHSTTIDLAVKNMSQIVNAAVVRMQVNRLASESARIGLLLGP